MVTIPFQFRSIITAAEKARKAAFKGSVTIPFQFRSIITLPRENGVVYYDPNVTIPFQFRSIITSEDIQNLQNNLKKVTIPFQFRSIITLYPLQLRRFLPHCHNPFSIQVYYYFTEKNEEAGIDAGHNPFSIQVYYYPRSTSKKSSTWPLRSQSLFNSGLLLQSISC